MFLKLILSRFIYKKAPALLVLFSFLLNSFSPVLAAWDDYEQGRKAFEQGDNRAAYVALRNVVYTQAVPYLEKIHSERKSRAKRDLTSKDLTETELKELESLLEAKKQDLRYYAREDQDFQVSMALKQFLKDSQKRKTPFPTDINRTNYGNYRYAMWLESSGKLPEAVRFFEHAINAGELAALRQFGSLDAKQKALFPLRDLYESELQILDLSTEDVFERMYKLALTYKTKAQELSGTNMGSLYNKRYQDWLRRTAKRGNILSAQQDLLTHVHMTAPELLLLSPTLVTAFPIFSIGLSDTKKSEERTSPQVKPYRQEDEREELNKKITISLLAYAAENGDGMAALHIGTYYKDGEIGDTPSPEKAFTWFTRAETLGCSEAEIALGQCYEYGLGVPLDKNIARQYYRKAAENGHLIGMFNAAIMALKTSEVEEAKAWLERSVSGRYRNSYPKLAELYTTQPGHENYARAAQLLREFFSSNFQIDPDIKNAVDKAFIVLLEQNIFSSQEEEEIFKYARFFRLPMALFRMGHKYFAQIQEAKDETLIERLAPRILEAFMPVIETQTSAKECLGMLTGDWAPQNREDSDKIRKAIEELCSQSDILSRFAGHSILGRGYHNGRGIYTKDTFKAASHYEEACKLCDQDKTGIPTEKAYEAFLNLGYLHMTGGASLDSAPNYEKARQFTQKATDFLSPEGTPYAMAYYNLSCLYENNVRETFRYLDIAAGNSKPVFPREGDHDAHHDLGLMYLLGENEYTPQNTDLAIQLLEKAARGGISRAYLTLGSIYANTQIGRRDILKAISYYEEGARKGELQCVLILGFIYLMGEKGVFEPNIEKAMSYIQKARQSGSTIATIDKTLTSLASQSQTATLLEAKAASKPLSREKSQKTKTERLIDQLKSTSLDSSTKWRKVERLLSGLTSLQGGKIKPGSGSVRHLHIGDTKTSIHELHQPGKERGLGHGRARNLQTLVGDVLNASEVGSAPNT